MRPCGAWPGLGAALPAHPHRALCPCQPTPGWWQCQAAAAVGSAPNRSSWFLPKAVGRHTGPAPPPAAAAAPRPALRTEPEQLLGPGEVGEGCGPLTAPSTRSTARVRDSSGELPWHPPASGKGAQSWALPHCAAEGCSAPSAAQPHCPVGTPSHPTESAASSWGTHRGLLLLRGLSGSRVCSCARSKLSWCGKAGGQGRSCAQ